jgi:hypothetical protein
MKKILSSDKVIKYAKARSAGLNKEQSKAIAGYSPETKGVTIENTETYKALSVKDTLLKHISLDDITKRHSQLIASDNEAVAINAIKLSYERIEPNTEVVEDNDRVTVILKG